MSIVSHRTSRRSTTALVLPTCLAACFAAGLAGVTGPAEAGPADRVLAVRQLEANLSPSGDPDGSGHADFRLNKARQRVCAEVTWDNIQTPDSAHIHRNSDGGVVVDLTGSVTGGAECRRNVRKRVIERILDHPRRYYFNVHNATYPAGAIQGTLHR
jgi:hypothetical protein